MEEIKKWDIEELESFFLNIDIPDYPIRLDSITKIVDVEKFLASHFAIAKAHNGNTTFKPYYERLLKLKNILSDGTNKIS